MPMFHIFGPEVYLYYTGPRNCFQAEISISLSLYIYIYLYLYKRIDIYMDPTSPTPIDLPSFKPKEFIKDQAVEP